MKRRSLLCVLAAGLAACLTPQVLVDFPNPQALVDGGLDRAPGDEPRDLNAGCASEAGCAVVVGTPFSLGKKLDLLFMIDNSSSMDAMAGELRDRAPELLAVFDDLASAGIYVDLHLGVVTSDYGAGHAGAPGCDPSPGGQRGQLQAIGAAADPGCQRPRDANYVKYAYAATGSVDNLPAAQTLAQTFSCMASVGTRGCGFEHQLESVYAALSGAAGNEGFLRDDALLAVMFVTNEDDGSAPPAATYFDRALIGQYGYEDTFRQSRFAVACGTPPSLLPYAATVGALQDCAGAPNPYVDPSRAYDVFRYINFFTRPRAQGGVKDDPSDVILAAIMAPASPVQVILTDPGTPGGVPYASCPSIDEGGDGATPCVPMLQHACVNAAHPGFFGDPSVRLSQVINAVADGQVSSICDDSYADAMTRLGATLRQRLQ